MRKFCVRICREGSLQEYGKHGGCSIQNMESGIWLDLCGDRDGRETGTIIQFLSGRPADARNFSENVCGVIRRAGKGKMALLAWGKQQLDLASGFET